MSKTREDFHIFETFYIKAATNSTKAKILKERNNHRKPKMETNCYLKPATTHNGSIRTDLPLVVSSRAKKRMLMEKVIPGQLFCIGKVYIKTHKGLIRIQ